MCIYIYIYICFVCLHLATANEGRRESAGDVGEGAAAFNNDQGGTLAELLRG